MELITDFDEPLIVGVIIDVSNNHDKNGDRIIDVVKKALVSMTTKMGMGGSVYISHPDNLEMPRTQGRSVASICDYQDPNPYFLDEAIKRAVHIVGNEDEDLEKHILYITDRYQKKLEYKLNKGYITDKKNDYGCHFHFIGLEGKCPDLNDVSSFEVIQLFASDLNEALSSIFEDK